MKKPWENDSCETIQACYSLYHVPVAAALWCGIPAGQVAEELHRAVPVGDSNALGRAILRHPYLKCLEPRIRAIHGAIDAGELPACREDGRKTDDHVAYDRRHVYGRDLKEWAKTIAPTERPAFLFDEIERKTHPSINADSFRALQADRGALATELKKTKDKLQKVRQEKNDLEGENQSLRAMVDRMSTAERENLPDSERDSLLKMVLGMAISVYKYDPGLKRNTATGDNRGSITADVSRVGLNLDSDTVRKFIKEAEERFGDLITKPDDS